MSAHPLRKQLSKRDPAEVVPVAEACELLDVSRATLYRLDSLPRVRLSPGRVGYRAADLVEYLQRDDARDDVPMPKLSNCWVEEGAGVLPDFLLSLAPRINTILRRRPIGKEKVAVEPFVVELPRAVDWGHRDLVVIDAEGLNVVAPTIIIPIEGEQLNSDRNRFISTQPRALIRIVPVFGCEKVPDGWWVA